MAADTPPPSRRSQPQLQSHKCEEGQTIWVPSPFDGPAPPNHRPRTRSAVGPSTGGWCDPTTGPSARPYINDGDAHLKVNYAGDSDHTAYRSAPHRFDPRSRSATSVEPQQREYNREPISISEPSFVTQPVSAHICPLCSLQLEDPLPALVLPCPQCDIKFCYFCNGRLGDGLPCTKRMCKVFRREFWREEDDEFNRYAVRPAKDKTSKTVKRGFQNAGYAAGVGACAVASAVIVAASIAAVPFTAGFSLLLMPTAIVPYEGARATLERRRRWTLQCKDKKRQSVRSQIRLSNENERQAGPARSEEPGPSEPFN